MAETRALIALTLLAMTSIPAQAAPAVEATLAKAKEAMMAEPDVAARLAQRALDQVKGRPDAVLARLEAEWLLGEALGRINQGDRATKIIDAALMEVARVAPNSKLHADLLMSRGALAFEKSDVTRAFRSYRDALAMFRRVGDTRKQAIALQNIGSIYTDAGDHARVLQYYEQSAEVHADDPALTLSAHNNRSLALRELGRLDEAEAELKRARKVAKELDAPILDARILSNLATVQMLQKRYGEARRSADMGLALAKGAAAEWAPFLWGVRAQIALRQGSQAEGLALLRRAFAGQDLAKTTFYFRDYHETAAEAFAAVGDDRAARLHLQALKRLDDEARAIRSSANAALAAAQFDFSNQELRISRLKAGQLERDIQIQQARGRQQMIALGATLALLLLTAWAALSLRRSRNRLAVSNVALEKALKAKSEFLATTSHEIRTPLNGILGMTQVLLHGREIDETVRERVKIVHSAGETMKAIVDDILDMAKIESGKLEVAREEVELVPLLRDVAQLWRDESHAKGLSLTVAADEAPALIEEDGRKLRQIVFNLMSNAVKFTDAGAVSLKACQAEGRLMIEVADTGIGIPAEQLDAIFEPFHQVDGGTDRHYGGTGLGLAIARNLAAAMDGTLTVESRLGEGARFTLSLPLRMIERAPVRPASGLGESRAVLIEANPLFASILSAAIGAQVGSVTVAGSWAEVANPGDVLIVDAASVPLDNQEWRAEFAAFRAAQPATKTALLGTGADPLFDVTIAKVLPVPDLTALSSLYTPLAEAA